MKDSDKNLVEQLGGLVKGWDSYNADPPSGLAISLAEAYLDIGGKPDRIKPSVIGGVGITTRRLGRKCYLEIQNDGHTHLLFSDLITGDKWVKEISLENALAATERYLSACGGKSGTNLLVGPRQT